MKILTGNDLRSGAVVWWDGSGWSLHVAQAADVGHDGDVIAAREVAARAVVSPYVIDGEKVDGEVRPAHIKDRIRALGPTVRLDLSLKPADPAAGDWVI
ncbi:MAG: DUF2849 domain-containing protein [Sphingomonadales bacterium]|nr:DUF2849 domain-containing protein [Sphingomonadales bacterium]